MNSTNADAAIAGGGGTVTAPEFYIAGGYTTTGGVIIANDASQNLRSSHSLRISLGLAMAILTWVMT